MNLESRIVELQNELANSRIAHRAFLMELAEILTSYNGVNARLLRLIQANLPEDVTTDPRQLELPFKLGVK